jgi:predicted ATP-grasp superfamily ATP-dependent carboligase
MKPIPASTSVPSIGIVGASTRAAAASAIRAGYQPVTADLFADADLQQFATTTRISPYPDGFFDWLRTMQPSAWMYTGALENHPELVDQMAWVSPLWGNGGDVLDRVRSPWVLSTVLRDAGLSFPETRASDEGLPRDGTWLAKTYRGASGSGVREVGQTRRQGDKETRRSASETFDGESAYLPVSLSPCPVYQRRIEGTLCAAAFVAAAGKAELLGVTRQLVGERWLGAHGFQYAGSIGPWPVAPAVLDMIRRVGFVVAERFELIGLFGVDIVLDGQQVWVLEVNPRYTASVEVVERATGVQAIAEHAAACGGLPIAKVGAEASSPPVGVGDDPAHRIAQVHGKAILFAKRNVVISKHFGETALAESSRLPWPTLADVSPPGTLIEIGRPILTLFADGTSTDDVEQRLKYRATELERHVYDA